jgi:hypothetical protein
MACHRFEETFPDCGSYVSCECYRRWCSDECAKEDGFKHEEWEDIDGDEWESRSCKHCRREDFTDTQLLEYVIKNSTVSREKLVEFCKSNYEITIVSVCEHERLMRDSDKLYALECAGVDNWEGYGDAMDNYYSDEDDEE